MAIRAKFEADFSSFSSAVEKAELQLKSFETGASKVGSAINKMADQFSGRKIIQEATLMTAAIEKMGGTTGLTEKEMKRISATVGEATAKMRAMGLEVPANMQKLADATEGVGKSASKSTSLLSGMAAQLAGMFTIGAVIAFGRQILQAGDQIQKMADQTGLTVNQVQKLQHIAGQSGSSIESLVGAVQNLQQRLGDDNSGAAGAIAKLGINLKDLKTQDPYQQMVTLAEGIRSIKDPTEQASTAAAIFGKSWKEILPAIKSGMEQVGNEAPQMAKEVVDSLDRIGDALTKAKSQGIVWGASFVTAIEKAGFAVGDFLSKFNPEHFGVANSQLLKMQAALNKGDGLVGAFSQASQGAQKLAKVVGGDLKPVVAATAEEEHRFNERLHASVQANDAAAKAAKERADAILRMSKEGLGAEYEWQNQILLTKFKLQQLTVTETQLYEQTRTMADFIREHKGELFPEPPPGSLEAWKKGQTAIKETMPLMVKLESVARSAIGGLNDIFQRAFEGGGGVGGAIKSFATSLTKGLLEMIPGVGKVLGQFAGAIVAGFSKIFGGLFGTAGRDAVREFAKGLGGFDEVHAKLGALGAAGEQLWIKLTQGVGRNNAEGAKAAIAAVTEALKTHEEQIRVTNEALAAAREQYAGIEERLGGLVTISPEVKAALDAAMNTQNAADFRAALDDVNGALDDQLGNARFLEETMKKYKIEWTSLGEEARKAKVAETTRDIIKEFDVLRGAGVDVNEIMRKMGPSIQDFVKQAKATGTEVPESFRRIIQTAIDAGELFDENGVKIEDMGKLGIAFGTTMEESMKDAAKGMSEAIQRLIELIEKQLGPAITNIPDGDFTIHGKYDPPKIPKGEPGPEVPPIVPQAMGGSGRVTKPTLFLAGEAGPEDYAFSGANKSFGAFGAPEAAPAQMVTIQIDASGAFFDTPASLQKLADKVSAALTADMRRQARFAAA